MIKAKELSGRAIVALSNGAEIDRVADILLDHDRNQVLALLTDKGGWLSDAKILEFEKVHTFGEDAIMVDVPDVLTTDEPETRLEKLLNERVEMYDKTLLTRDGRNLGMISGIFFDEHSGEVVGYVATGGLFSDFEQTPPSAPESYWRWPRLLQEGKSRRPTSGRKWLARQSSTSSRAPA